MNDKSYEELMTRMNIILAKYNTHLVSPNPTRSKNCSDEGLIKDETNINDLNNDELLLMHAQLHMLYGSKGGRHLSLSSIKRLHKEISQKINHKKFDSLDT